VVVGLFIGGGLDASDFLMVGRVSIGSFLAGSAARRRARGDVLLLGDEHGEIANGRAR
jgi:hypothetical protein